MWLPSFGNKESWNMINQAAPQDLKIELLRLMKKEAIRFIFAFP